MAYTIVVHIANEDAFLAEVEALPKPDDNVLIFTNPRKRDGKPLTQLDQDANVFLYPWTRVNYVEVMEQRASRDELIEFFRDE